MSFHCDFHHVSALPNHWYQSILSFEWGMDSCLISRRSPRRIAQFFGLLTLKLPLKISPKNPALCFWRPLEAVMDFGVIKTQLRSDVIYFYIGIPPGRDSCKVCNVIFIGSTTCNEWCVDPCHQVYLNLCEVQFEFMFKASF